MATLKEKEILESQVLTPIGKNHRILSGSKVTGFLSMAGHHYNNGLMVVGRAVNGWVEGISPASLTVPLTAKNHSEEVFGSVTGTECPMSWVTERWGASNGYNTKRSAFWRVIRKVVESHRIADVHSREWPSYLVWSNLYKVAPASGGNPNGTLCSLQLAGCISLMSVELSTYRPSLLLFLTGMNWAKPFIEAFGMSAPCNNKYHYVEGFGNTIADNCEIGRYVIASHPQGKPEDPWVKEVMEAFSR